MNVLENIKQRFDQLQQEDGSFAGLRDEAYKQFNKRGVPTVKNEEWKYTRIGSLFNKEYDLQKGRADNLAEQWRGIQLPGHEEANVLIFLNGMLELSLSVVRSNELNVVPLDEAARNQYKDIVAAHFNHSASYLKDGINALNTALLQGGVFVYVNKGDVVKHPVYIYNVLDAENSNVFAQPRSLFYIGENAQVQMVETYNTIGKSESFTNQVMEVVIEKDAVVEYYKIQNDSAGASQVSTTHFRQIGKSYIHTVTISLNGDIVRNNLNIIMDAERSEAHLYGLYFQGGSSHIDNHTVVDNVKPNCFSNELYKGIMSDEAIGVFNGKIFVRQDAQKTNAYQSNKNILLSDNASVNSKPQLEIFADDVKCSHGCTVGQLDEEALFYLQSRGISEDMAKSLLVHAFAEDILEHIKLEPIRHYVEKLISKRSDSYRMKNRTT